MVDIGTRAAGADASGRVRAVEARKNKQSLFVGIGALDASLAYTRPCCAFDRDAAPPAPGSDTRVELNFTYKAFGGSDVLEARLGGFEALNSTYN